MGFLLFNYKTSWCNFGCLYLAIILMTTRKSGRDWYLASAPAGEGSWPDDDDGNDYHWLLLGSHLRWRVLVAWWLPLAGGEFWSDLIWSSVIYQRDLDLAWLTNILQSSITTITTSQSGQDLWDIWIVKWLEHHITHFALLHFIILTLNFVH